MNNLLSYLDDLILTKYDAVKNWITSHYTTSPCLYSSVDIRYSGSKIVPVDTNLFPAGFNNLSEESIMTASKLTKDYIQAKKSQIEKILIIAESHTRNLGYLNNVLTLHRIFTLAGFEVKLATFDHELEGFALNDKIKYHSIKFTKNKIVTNDDFAPDAVVINNDMTAGYPKELHDIDQLILTPMEMGWHQRQKIAHMRAYDNVINNFSEEFKIPKFLLQAEFGFCRNINFKEKKGLDCVANEVEKVLFKIRSNYQKFDIKDKPYVYIKANKGTYGMGIMTVDSGEQIYEINKKERNKMAVIKNNIQNAQIVVQEGVKTIVTHNNKPAEGFVYQMAGQTAGIIYRINQTKNEYANLNSSGVEFKSKNREELGNFYNYYDMIASLSTLATTIEHDYSA